MARSALSCATMNLDTGAGKLSTSHSSQQTAGPHGQKEPAQVAWSLVRGLRRNPKWK